MREAKYINMLKDIKNFKTLMIFLSLAVILIINTSLVSAAGISVNKAALDFKNVLKGGYAEDIIYVASDTDFDVPLGYQTLGDIKDWITFDPDLNNTNNTVYISRDHIQPLRIILQPPVDTPAGNYTGSVRVITGTINRPEGPYGSQLQAAFLIRISIEVTGSETLACNFGGVNIPDTEIGKPLEFYMTVSNNGNIRIRPNVSIDFWNQDQTKLVSTMASSFGNAEILPTTAKTLFTTFDNNFKIGQYWAYATISPCDQSQLISFSVLEKGAIADNGELIRIENKPWAKVDEIVPITAYFRNTGTRIVSAKLKGVITLDNKIVENIDSDYYDIAPSEIANITVYFTPKKFGQYFISGRVLYNNKLSFEKSSVLNVNEGIEKTEFNWTYTIILIIIIIIILLLLINIRKKKNRQRL